MKSWFPFNRVILVVIYFRQQPMKPCKRSVRKFPTPALLPCTNLGPALDASGFASQWWSTASCEAGASWHIGGFERCRFFLNSVAIWNYIRKCCSLNMCRTFPQLMKSKWTLADFHSILNGSARFDGCRTQGTWFVEEGQARSEPQI